MAKSAKPTKPEIKPKSFRPSVEANDVLQQLMEQDDRSLAYVVDKAILFYGESKGIKPSKPAAKKP